MRSNTLFAVQPAGARPHRLPSLDFDLPETLEAKVPPEARGLARDEVRLMVSQVADDEVSHSRFVHLPDYLQAGDTLVVNTSGTMNAAVNAERADGTRLELHLSTHLPGDLWTVEVRSLDGGASEPFYDVESYETLRLPEGAEANLLVPYSRDRRRLPDRGRLWIATLQVPLPLEEYLRLYGSPIRYGYVEENWPASYYQTIYATEIGSAEMPSAGRAFTPELITRLVASGVRIAPLILHTGVASLEEGEPPYEEYYRVPSETAQAVNAAHAVGKKVVAVGTTAVRALETTADKDGAAHPSEGWTDLVVTPERGLRTVDAMLTGLHEPRSSHLAMLGALAGRDHLRLAYGEALKEGYLWHEFGDLHLILP